MTPTDTFGLRINEAVCFSGPKGQLHEGTRRRQLKFLRPLVPLLRQFMEPDEEILLAVRACSPMTTLESMTMGVFIYYLKRCVLVVTNKRILHFPTRANYAPNHSIAEIRHGDIAKAKLRGFLGRALGLTYTNGTRERFQYIQSKEFKKLKTLLGTPPKDGQPSAARGRQHLCPKCMSPLPARRSVCPACRLEFKDRARARRLALLVPGGGFFYTGHPRLGILSAIGETALLLGTIVLLYQVGTGEPDEEDVGALIAVALVFLFEKLISVHHAQHALDEYIPVDQEVVPIKSHAR